MNLPGTDMHLVTFTITLIEVLLAFFQIIYFIQRPSDKQRLWYLILLLLLIQYNIAGSIFPDEQFSAFVPVKYQLVYSYFTGALMSMYFAFYIYKAFKLERLRHLAIYGSLYYIGVPFILLWAIPYAITGNFDLFNKLVVIIPFFYGMAAGRAIYRAFKEKYAESLQWKDVFYKERLVTVYLALIFWLSMPVVTYFEGSQLLEHSLTNTGFLIMTISYIRSIVHKSRQEYLALKESEARFRELTLSLQEKVKNKTDHLQELLEQNTNTFINLAHELKTPVAVLQNYLNYFVSKNELQNNKEFEVIVAATNKISRDIVNFFDIEKFKKGSEVYNNESITNFSQTLSLSVELFICLASKKNIQLTSTIEKELYIQGDQAAIERIINNLIENAIKYTEEGKSIFVKLSSQDHQLIFTVHDEGIGIKKEKQQSIFEPYSQINTRKRNLDGMGMGLAIVKQIVKLLGGKISVTSEPGRGSTFQITLNRHSLFESETVSKIEVSNYNYIDLETEELEDAVFDEERPTIMIVEDQRQLLTVLKQSLSQYYNVYVASDGAFALKKLEKNIHVDLIVSDIMMDIVGGFELRDLVSKSKRYSSMPFVFLTAKTGTEAKVMGHERGGVAYIEKPFDVMVLKAQIDIILELREKHQNQLLKSVLTQKQDNGMVEDRDWFVINSEKYGLTPREKEVCKFLLEGNSAVNIGEKLNISPHTVKKHMKNAYEKVGVKNKVHLIKVLEKVENTFS